MFNTLQLLFLCIAIMLLPTTSVKAKTIVVDTTSDSPSDNCSLLNKCCLRSAIAKADVGDTITFQLGPKESTITLIYGELTINKDQLTIDGDLDNDLSPDITIDGNFLSRVFRIADHLFSVELNGLIIKNGRLYAGASEGGSGILIGNDCITDIKNSTIESNYNIDGSGGGILQGSSILFLDNCSLQSNKALNGGAIYNWGDVYIFDSSIDGNESQGEGGGIYNHPDGYLLISGSVVSYNHSRKYSFSTSPMYNGGGVTNKGDLRIHSSTFEYNRVLDMTDPSFPGIGNGGGIYNSGGTAIIRKSSFLSNLAGKGGAVMNNHSLQLLNSTFSKNIAYESGGGLFNSTSPSAPGSEESLEIINCTFYDNWSFGGFGGGIYFFYATSLNGEHISNSIIAASYTHDCYIVPGHGSLETNTSNLIEDGLCSPALNGDPLLRELAYNGGPTKTFALLPDSPAINSGSNDKLLWDMAHDQRSRGFPRIHNDRVDIGSYEFKKTHFFVVPHSNGKAVIFGL